MIKEQILEVIRVEHYTAMLLFKPKNCEPATLEEAIMLMEAYASSEAGLYLIPKAWRKGTHKAPPMEGQVERS